MAMREVPAADKSFADQVRELQSLHTAALEEKERRIIQLQKKLEKAESELAQARGKRNIRDRLNSDCQACLYRIQYQKRQGEVR
jgi:hypothetical protein